jgi:ribosomal protein L24E
LRNENAPIPVGRITRKKNLERNLFEEEGNTSENVENNEEVDRLESLEEEEAFVNGLTPKKVNWTHLGSHVHKLFRRVVGIETMFLSCSL